jgi:CHASE3 domain sensor protein
MKISVEKKIVFGFAIALGVLIALGAVTYFYTDALIKNYRLVSHTQKVLVETDGVLSAVTDAQTGQRGFILTGHEDFLEPYQAALPEVETRIEICAAGRRRQIRTGAARRIAQTVWSPKSSRISKKPSNCAARAVSEAAQQSISTGAAIG